MNSAPQRGPPATANPGQEDADSDGPGDVCDTCANDPLNDADTDGLCAEVDNCPADANPAQADADSDGAGDACDVCPADPLDDFDAVFGVLALREREEASGSAEIEEWVEERIAARAAARADRDFAQADAIRDELLDRGVALEDGPSGTRWKLVSQAD